MALFSIEGKEQTHIPHKVDYDRWMANMSDSDHQGVIDAIHEYMDSLPPNEQIFVSSYIPGKDWSDTPYDPIYRACNENWHAARLFFGQLVWEAVQLHEEMWLFKNHERDEEEIPLGKTYFRPEVT